MNSIFDAAERSAVRARIERLQAQASRQWGKMEAAQMMAHCALPLEVGTGDLPAKQSLFGKLVSPLARKAVFGPEPFKKNAPTGFRVLDARDFGREKARLLGVLDRFAAAGPAKAASHVHPFFGRLSGDDWGRLMWKHLDHHLRQFSS